MDKATQTEEDPRIEALLSYNSDMYAEIQRLRSALRKSSTTPLFGVVGVVGLVANFVFNAASRFFSFAKQVIEVD